MNPSEETQLGRELRQLVADQPFRPDIDAIGRRARKRRQRNLTVRGAASAGAAVVVAGGLFTALHGTGGTAPTGTAAVKAPGASTLMTLAANVTAGSDSQPGDASFVVTTPSLGGTTMGITYEVYTDSGDIYWAASRSDLSAAIANHQTVGNSDVTAAVAAAKYAAKGDLTTARGKMAAIVGPAEQQGDYQGEWQKSWIKSLITDKGKFAEKLKENPGIEKNTSAGKSTQEVAGDAIWTSSMDALTAGGGNPEVRAGVLRLLATVPEIKVTNSTTGGEATLTLTASSALFGGGPAEVLTIDAKTGSPVKFSASAGGGMQAAVATFKVTRVSAGSL